MSEYRKIVLLDLWTDANRGDNSLQSGLIAMVRDRWPNSVVKGVFRFGINEFEDAKPEIASTYAKLDDACGGLRRTYYSARNHNRFSGVSHLLISLYSFLELGVILALAKLRLKILLPDAYKDTIKAIQDADLVIWKGKNFRDYGGLKGLNRQSTLLVAGVIGNWLNDNMVCLNASVWEMSNPLERRISKWVLSRCKMLTARERPSEKNLRELLDKEQTTIVFAQDLSFYDLSTNHKAQGQPRRSNIAKQYDLALTITDWGSKTEKEKYQNTILSIIQSLGAKGAKRVAIVPQVTRASESNLSLVKSITEKAHNIELDILPGAPEIGELLNIYERSNMIVGTRMHSCVFARSVGTPFIAIAYDAGPKWDILSEFWPRELLFEYNSCTEEVVAAAEHLYENRDAFLRESSPKFAELSRESFLNVSSIRT